MRRSTVVEPSERELFLLLFYRERLGRLYQRLDLQESAKTITRIKHRRWTTRRFDLNVAQVADLLHEIQLRAEDETRCNDICKSMYFCDRKKRHKGPHREGALSWPV